MLSLRSYIATFFILLLANSISFASSESTGVNGINSTGLIGFDGQPLTGTGVAIGQVEAGRPGKSTVPPGDTAANSNTFVKPQAVFTHQSPATSTDNAVDNHAEHDAGVMISTDNTDPMMIGDTPIGVSTGASLYSSAYLTGGTAGYQDALLAMQFIAQQNSDGVRAINNSWGKPTISNAPIDGNSLLTLGLDYLAKEHDALFVVAGNEFSSPNNPIPTDNLNGLTVGASVKSASGKFDKVGLINDFSQQPVGHTAIDLIAPGDLVRVSGLNNAQDSAGGTSTAAPHVTGTVALLQQYGNQRNAPTTKLNWSDDYQHHEVMKAVLMNSADKLIDNHMIMAGGDYVPQGGLLGMDRTVTNQFGGNWLSSPAYDDDFNTNDGLIALDPQMGTGELDAKRARTQLAAGEFHSFQANGHDEVPVIGWDYGQTRPALPDNSHPANIYRLNQTLVGGSFVSVTLTFDRTVQKSGTEGIYSSGDSFTASTDTIQPGEDQISDLDIYLLPKNASSTSQAIAFSEAFGTVDHLFFQIPFNKEGQYEIWITQFNDNIDPEKYAVAWWADGKEALTSGVGDINQDGHIDATDIHAMQQALANESTYANLLGVTTDYLSLLGDMNGDGLFTNADIQSLLNFLKDGNGSTSVPEPASLVLLAMGGLALIYKKRLSV